MHMSRREKITLIAGAVVAGLTVLIAWGVVPLARHWSELGQRLEPRLETLSALRERTQQRGSLLVRRDRLAGQIGLLAGPPPTEPAEQKPDAEEGKDTEEKPPENPAELPELEARLEKVFQGAGANIKSLTVKRISRLGLKPEHFRPVGFQVETETKIDSLIKLLHALEKGPRFMRVDRLRLHHEENKPTQVRVSLDIVAYERVSEG